MIRDVSAHHLRCGLRNAAETAARSAFHCLYCLPKTVRHASVPVRRTPIWINSRDAVAFRILLVAEKRALECSLRKPSCSRNEDRPFCPAIPALKSSNFPFSPAVHLGEPRLQVALPVGQQPAAPERLAYRCGFVLLR